MNKWIVVTTINPPQPAILAISELCKNDGWKCVVIGDKKTPKDWHVECIDYLSVVDQEALYPELSKILPYNHYCRKNIGYLYAAGKSADIILETDDDNIPMPEFGKSIKKEIAGRSVGAAKWINVYKYFTNTLIWPRGNPLDSIHDRGEVTADIVIAESPLQQFLADGDPDVDAIYRLLYKHALHFNKERPVILEKGTWCSFNSQNTLFFKEFFPLLYLPCHVSFRMTDIWRSFVAQAVLWSEGKKLSFHSATVVQVRNEHNLMRDFKDEVVGYVGNREICDILEKEMKNWSAEMSIKAKVIAAWKALEIGGYINTQELLIANTWMKALEN